MKIPSSTHSKRTSSIEVLESRITPGSISFPSVVSINRETPATAGTTAGSVVYKVTFSENVTGVDPTDFDVFTSVDAKANPLVAVTGSGKSYTVTVNGLQGNGDVRLDLVDDNTIAVLNGMEPFSLGGFGLGDGSFTGETYRLLQTGPKVSSIATVGPTTTEASSVSWKVTFSEAVTGVDAADFALIPGPGVLTPNPLTVTPVSATVYTVSVTGLGGNGTIGLNLVDDTTIRDTNNNPLQTSPIDFPVASTWSAVSGVSAVATGDVNGDGKPDFVVTNEVFSGSASVSVFLGNGDGSFQTKVDYITGSQPKSVVIADVSGDGRPDIVVTGSSFSGPPSYTSTTVSVLLGNGDGTFQPKQDYGDGYGHRAVAVGDLNGDGRPDLAVTAYNSGSSTVNVMLGNGNGTFQAQQTFTTGADPRSVAIGDVNGDGHADVVTGNSQASTVSVLLGTGTGALGTKTDFATGNSPRSVALADLSGDGKLDIVVANYGSGSNSVSVLLGNGAGSFGAQTTFATNSAPSGVAVADYNGDGKLDLAVTHAYASMPQIVGEGSPEAVTSASAQVSVLLGNGNGTFQAKQDFSNDASGSFGIAVADFDGDGKGDLVTANGYNSSASTLLNGGNGDFTGPLYSIGVVAPDLSIVSITDGQTDADPGELLTYQITYKNLSTKAATGAKLSVVLPDELTFVAKENPGWTLAGNILTKTISGKVAGGKTGKVKLKLHVQETADAFTSGFDTVVTITDDGTHGEDFDFKNNQGSDYDNLAGFTPDLAISSANDDGIAFQGNVTTYKLHYSNVGNRDAGASITVTLPDDTTFNAAGGTPGWVDNLDGTYTLHKLDLPAEGMDQIAEFSVNVDPAADVTTPLSLAARIESEFGFEETNLDNNEVLEQTPFYSGIYVTSPGVAVAKKFAPPVVRVFDRATGLEIRSFLAYEETYRDSIRVAVGDFNDDGIDDIVTTTQQGTGRLRVFDGLTGEQFDKGAFGEEIAVFDGIKDKGAFVAVGDVTGDGYEDIVVGSALGGGKVKVYDGNPEQETATVIKEYTPFGTKFKGGVRVAVGDVNGGEFDQDTITPQAEPISQFGFIDDIIVGQGYYGGQVKVYDGATDVVLQDFSVGKKGYRGGVSVAAGDLDGDGLADLVVGRNSGKPSIVEVFSGLTLAPIGLSINPFDADPLKPKNTFGVRVAVVDVNFDGVADIITSVGVKNGSQVKIYSGNRLPDGSYEILADRTITAYEDYPDVALWVAGSRDQLRRIPA